jgi:hypothetical protein
MKRILYFFLLLLYSGMMQSCNSNDSLLSTKTILVTSESGDKLTEKENIRFIKGEAEGTILKVEPEITKQPIDGIGAILQPGRELLSKIIPSIPPYIAMPGILS